MKKILFILSVDTEEEWNWQGEFPRGVFSTNNGRQIHRFQQFCNELGIRPTYFVDYAMADDLNSVQHLHNALTANTCEIASHLHPWCTPPVIEENTLENSYIINLPAYLLEKKLINLTAKLEEAFGQRPRTFRSGRWGMNGRILQLLAKHDYTVDSSIYPYYRDLGFDYTSSPDIPYWPDFRHCTRPGSQRQILEIPVSSGFNRGNFPAGQKIFSFLARRPLIHLRLIGVLSRLGIFYKVQLSPEPASASEMITCAHACVKNGHRVLHMFLHSSSLLAGGNPYVPTEQAVSRIYGRIEQTIIALKDYYFLESVTLQEAAELLFP